MTAAIVVPHKFIIGQAVGFSPPRAQYAPPGIYLVTAKLPDGTANLNITLNIPANCTNALQRKASFMRPADDAPAKRTVIRARALVWTKTTTNY